MRNKGIFLSKANGRSWKRFCAYGLLKLKFGHSAGQIFELQKKEVRIQEKGKLVYRLGFPAQGWGKIKGPTPQASQPHTTDNLGFLILAVKRVGKRSLK
ncbi:MAG: hypothetical protein N3B16_06150 [Candidatus Aminicenantes bacterium]|nr:hypothetical protein [Candidatus Aminicenantes bacterium]